MTSGIYTITNLVTGKVYVGSSINIERRFKEHQKLLRGARHHSPYLQHAWAKHGEREFCFELLLECDPEFLLGAELFWLNTLRSYEAKYGYNIASVPSSKIGVKHSDTTKDAIRQKAIGRTIPSDVKRKLADASRGKRHSTEAIKKISQSNLGREVSRSTRHRISASRGGCPFVAVEVASNHFAGAFRTLRDAAESLGVDPSNIRKCLIGKLTKCNGYTFQYLPSP